MILRVKCISLNNIYNFARVAVFSEVGTGLLNNISMKFGLSGNALKARAGLK
jgi:hypothetical protein